MPNDPTPSPTRVTKKRQNLQSDRSRTRLRRWEALNGVAAIWSHNLAASQLLVGIGRICNQLLLILHNSKSGEAIAWTELTGPTGRDSEGTADITVGVRFVCFTTLDLKDRE